MSELFMLCCVGNNDNDISGDSCTGNLGRQPEWPRIAAN